MKRLILVLMLITGPVWALDPSEMLADPVLEARARALDDAIRCVQCQSEAISSSNANWAQDARRMIRELIAGGASDEEVLDWFEARYGPFALMEPRKDGVNRILWAAGPAMALIGLFVAWRTIRARSSGAVAGDALTEEEQARLDALLKNDGT